jgi:hypothetical protein
VTGKEGSEEVLPMEETDEWELARGRKSIFEFKFEFKFEFGFKCSRVWGRDGPGGEGPSSRGGAATR